MIGLSLELGIGLPEIELWPVSTIRDYMAYKMVPQEALEKAAAEDWFNPPESRATAEELEAARKRLNTYEE